MKVSTTVKRFREGAGKRYLEDGATVRCQAVAKSKLDAIRGREGNPDLEADDVWPEAQCEHAAVPGKLLCGGRGGHGGNSMTVPKYDPIMDMPVDMQDKMRELIQNPSLLSRRFEITQLVARYLVLYERLQKNEALGHSSLDYIREGLNDIGNGEVAVGTIKIAEALDLRQTEREIYGDIYQTMGLLKDMTRTEIQSIKELKSVITIEQFIAAMDGVAADLMEALEAYVPDESTRRLVAGSVEQRIARRFNAGSGRILEAVAQVGREGAVSPSESLAE